MRHFLIWHPFLEVRHKWWWCLWHLWCEWSPNAKAQKRPQVGHATALVGSGLLSICCSLLSSKAFVPLEIAMHHPQRSSACLAQLSTGILQAFWDSFKLSLNLVRGCPGSLSPADSSEKKTAFGSRVSSIRTTCPIQWSWALITRASIPSSCACRRTSVFETLSFHAIFIILRRQRR